MKIFHRKTLLLLSIPLFMASVQAAERFPPAYFTVKEQLHNYTFSFDTGLPAETIATPVKGQFDAVTGLTRDIKGQYSIFHAYMAPGELKRFLDLFDSENYTHINGSMQCKVVHLGTGPIVPPAQKFGIVADDCVFKSLKPVW